MLMNIINHPVEVNKVRIMNQILDTVCLLADFHPNSLDFIRQLQRWIGGIDWWRWLVKCQLARNIGLSEWVKNTLSPMVYLLALSQWKNFAVDLCMLKTSHPETNNPTSFMVLSVRHRIVQKPTLERLNSLSKLASINTDAPAPLSTK